MKKLIVPLVMIAMAVALTGCAQLPLPFFGNSGGSSSSSVSSSSTVSSTAKSSSSSTQVTPQITMGELSLLDVHGTDTGVGADAVVQVKNTSSVPLVLGAPHIRIADESGKVIVDEGGNGIMTGPSYLRPGDTGFIYTTGPVPLPSGYFPGYNYKLQGTADVSACKEVHEYPISNKSISDGGNGAPMVSGTVTNDDSVKADLVEISVAYLDNGGNLMGVASTIVTNLAPGQSKSFTIDGYTLPVSCTLAIVSDYDVIAVAPKY